MSSIDTKTNKVDIGVEIIYVSDDSKLQKKLLKCGYTRKMFKRNILGIL